MPRSERSLTDDVVGEMATALSESTRYLVDKAESFNKSETLRLERLVFVLFVSNVTLLVTLIAGSVLAWHEITNLLDSHNSTVGQASEALVNTSLTEKKLDQFTDKQKQFNQTVIEALEELSK